MDILWFSLMIFFAVFLVALFLAYPGHFIMHGTKTVPIKNTFGVLQISDLERSSLKPEIDPQLTVTRTVTYAPVDRLWPGLAKYAHSPHISEVLVKVSVADDVAGLCFALLYMGSSSQDESITLLEYAKVHLKGKNLSGQFTEEDLALLFDRLSIQLEVVKCYTDSDGPQHIYSLFGADAEETFRRRIEIAQDLLVRDFRLACKLIHEFDLPGPYICASGARSLAERKRQRQLIKLLENMQGVLDSDGWEKVLHGVIKVYTDVHGEQPYFLTEMLAH